jgi:putative membrane-bound dehydrogenase-like protein
MMIKSLRFQVLLGLNLCLFTLAFGQKSQSVRTRINTPEEELAGFKVAEGFVIELVASERDSVVNPVDLTFDDAGRLWTQTARMYPLDPVADIQWNDLLKLMDDPEAQKNHPNFKRILDLYQGKTKGTDKIIVLSDLNNKKAVKSSVWADGLTIPMSILPYKNGAYVAQGSELFFLNDADKDGKADTRTPLLTGFGFTDTHTMAHVLIRAPGDWVHFSHGALNKGQVSSYTSDAKLRIDFSKIVRMSLDATKIELVNCGLNNIWGFQLRHNGEWYGSEANDLGYSVTPLEPGMGFPGIGNEHLRPYQPFVPALHTFRVGGTGISGTAFADDASGSFPDEYKNVAFLANPITSTINAVQIVRNADGSITSKHLPDLLTSEDDWFRPVNIEFGPDGALYIADWYNKIVSHNELPTTHPNRDKSHGRIWRIRHVSQKPRDIPNLYLAKTEDLIDHLQSPSLWEKRAAWHQLSDRPRNDTKSLIPKLVALAADNGQDEITRIHALWSLEGMRHYDNELVGALLKSPLDQLRREAVRSLNSFSLPTKELSAALKGLIYDANPAIRSQVIRTIEESGSIDTEGIDMLVRACKPELPGNAMGGAYERRQERFLARKALEAYAGQLQDFIDQPISADIPVTNLLWATQALPKNQKETAFLKLWPKAGMLKIDEPTFVSIASMLDNKAIFDMIKPVIENPANAADYVKFAVQNQAQIPSSPIAELIKSPVNKLLADATHTDLALDAIGRYKIPLAGQRIASRLTEQVTDNTMKLGIKALETNAKANLVFFEKLVQNKKLSFDIQALSLASIVKTDLPTGQKLLSQWLPLLQDAEKRELVGILSGSVQGAELLKNEYERKQVNIDAFSLSSAERVVNANKDDRRGNTILDAIKKAEEDKKNAFKGKLNHYLKIAEKNIGNPNEGKILFQTCLSCHQVGSQGQSIAPALDGSASRDNEALLTAILNPDAAVESGYAVYRITKKDGSSLEGYLVQKGELGTTIAFMGGAKTFVETSAIRSQGFLGGRSFMVKGLIDHYSDKQVADLLSYIKTLK